MRFEHEDSFDETGCMYKTMKIALIIILLSISAVIFAQKHTIFATYQPVDFGVGIRYDYISITKQIGVETSISYGNYNMLGNQYIHDHWKETAGILFSFKGTDNTPFILGIILSHNSFGKINVNESTFNGVAINEWSADVATGIRIKHRYNISIRYDPIKHESSIDLGYSFYKLRIPNWSFTPRD